MAVTDYCVIDGEIVSEIRNGTERDYVPDPLGSTVALLDNTQTQTDTFSYWPYGEVRTSTGSTVTPFRFVGTLGYYRDAAIRTYVRAREYQQNYGRWTEVDSLWPGEPAYVYCTVNPTTFGDPIGEQVPAEQAQPLQWKIPPNRKPRRFTWSGHTGFGTAFAYGGYCGSDNVKNPGWLIEPQDRLDACCETHDKCLQAHYGAGYDQTDAHWCCDSTLWDCANWILATDQCRKWYRALGGSQKQMDDCEDAANRVRKAMAFNRDWWYGPGSKSCLQEGSWAPYLYKYWGNPNCGVPSGYNTNPPKRRAPPVRQGGGG